MPRLLSSAQVVAILVDHGFHFVAQKGSHQKYRNAAGRTTIVPAARKEIPRGTLRSIIRQSGLSPELFD